MSEKKLQIFIGSTFTDLKEERDALTRAILRTGNIPVGMEQFLPSDEESWGVITQYIDTSDGYFLILGHRYGSIHKKENRGYTELEYEYAKSRGVPVYAMLLARDCKKDADETSQQRDLYDLFRSRLMEERNIREWKDRYDLETTAITVIATDKTLQSRPGWHRSRVDAAESLAELTRLSNENRELRAEIERLISQSEPQVAVDVLMREISMYSYSLEDLLGDKANDTRALRISVSLGEILLRAARFMIAGCDDWTFGHIAARLFYGEDTKFVFAPYRGNRRGQDDLGMLGLAEARTVTIQRGAGPTLEPRWTLTDMGRKIFLELQRRATVDNLEPTKDKAEN